MNARTPNIYIKQKVYTQFPPPPEKLSVILKEHNRVQTIQSVKHLKLSVGNNQINHQFSRTQGKVHRKATFDRTWRPVRFTPISVQQTRNSPSDSDPKVKLVGDAKTVD